MTCPLFVELCAGTAAVSLRLHRARARPPVSRMGSKAGYADILLGLLGLRPGQGATDGTRYLWCEPDPGVRLLLEAYRDAGLARAAADIIRGWAGEDPRALWERLRAEGLPCLPADIAPDARAVEPREVARWMQTRAWCFRPGMIETGFRDPYGGRSANGGALGCDGLTSDGLARRAEGLPCLPAGMVPDAREVDPREVARWAFVQRVSGRGAVWGATCDLNGNGGCDPRTGQRFPFSLAKNTIPIDEHGTLPADIAPDARTIDPGPCLPPGTVAYMDPPYVGTTGYAADLTRAEVVALALKWQAAGAVVAVSEAVPVEELVALGWHAVDIGHTRRGQKRTFARVSSEWVTMSRAPERPTALARQEGLFGS